jgi:lysophospholipase L1-like esterase
MGPVMRTSLLATIALALIAQAASAAPPARHWVQSFELSPAALKPPDNLPKEVLARFPPPFTVKGTLRYRFSVSIGGNALRVQLSNPYGDKPLRIGAASVALAASGLDAQPATLHRLNFGGQPAVEVPVGAPVLSDPVDLKVADRAELVVSVYLPDGIPGDTFGGNSMLQADDDAVMSPAPANAKAIAGRPVVSGVLVARDRPTGVIVALGDSITDGVRSSPTEPRGWVAALTRRMADQHGGLKLGIVTAGINGNRILSGGMGVAALARADSDVYAVPGVTHLIVLQGINDIGMSGDSPMATGQAVVAPTALITGLTQLAERAHARGIKVYAGTILPFRGAFYFADDKEQTRLAVNAWIRKTSVFDGVIDFEDAMKDPARPDALNPAYDSGDHLHPSDAGYRAMAQAVPLKLFN